MSGWYHYNIVQGLYKKPGRMLRPLQMDQQVVVWSFAFLGDGFWIISESISPPEVANSVHSSVCAALHVFQGTSCPLESHNCVNTSLSPAKIKKKSLKRWLRQLLNTKRPISGQKMPKKQIPEVSGSILSTHLLALFSYSQGSAFDRCQKHDSRKDYFFFLIRYVWSTALMLCITKPVCKQKQ